MTHNDKLLAVAQAEDTYDLLSHIAWTDVVKPKLEEQVRSFSKLLVSEALGTPIPGGHSREQIAGMCYGINFITLLLEKILTKGEKALKDLNAETGVSLL